MIIGINGKIGAGKDTVGSIIQYLDLCKKANKTNLSYSEYINSAGWITDWEIKKYAGKLKQIGSILTGIPVENFEDQEFKKSLLGTQWGTVQDVPLNSIPPFADMQFNALMSVREFLQKLGTEAMRDGLHVNTWVNALFADYKPLMSVSFGIMDLGASTSQMEKMSKSVPIEYPNWIITDMRFPNEMESVVKRNGITIRVVRPHGYTDPNTGVYKEMPLSYHPSETSLDDAKFDYEIINDGTMEKLVKKVRKILIKEKLI